MAAGEATSRDNVTLVMVTRNLRIRNSIRPGLGAKRLRRDGEDNLLADKTEDLICVIFLDSDTGFGM